MKGFRCRAIAGVATSPLAGVGKPPGKEPAGCFAEDAPQALWGFRRCLRHGQAVLTPLREDVRQILGVVLPAEERRCRH